jgi:hypothetical protein
VAPDGSKAASLLPSTGTRQCVFPPRLQELHHENRRFTHAFFIINLKGH